MPGPLLRPLVEEVRQRGHHAAFRISSPLWVAPQRRELERLLDARPEPERCSPDPA